MTLGFIRIKLIEAQAGTEVWQQLEAHGLTWDPYTGVQVKEAVEVPNQGIQLIQKKKTFYPDWNKCFDTHLYDGECVCFRIPFEIDRGFASHFVIHIFKPRGLHIFYRQLDFSSEPGVANEILENDGPERA